MSQLALKSLPGHVHFSLGWGSQGRPILLREPQKPFRNEARAGFASLGIDQFDIVRLQLYHAVSFGTELISPPQLRSASIHTFVNNWDTYFYHLVTPVVGGVGSKAGASAWLGALLCQGRKLKGCRVEQGGAGRKCRKGDYELEVCTLWNGRVFYE